MEKFGPWLVHPDVDQDCYSGRVHVLVRRGKPQLTDWLDPVLVKALMPGSEQVSESRKRECDVLPTMLAQAEVAEGLLRTSRPFEFLIFS